jgi:hypothetical protein
MMIKVERQVEEMIVNGISINLYKTNRPVQNPIWTIYFGKGYAKLFSRFSRGQRC